MISLQGPGLNPHTLKFYLTVLNKKKKSLAISKPMDLRFHDKAALPKYRRSKQIKINRLFISA